MHVPIPDGKSGVQDILDYALIVAQLLDTSILPKPKSKRSDGDADGILADCLNALALDDPKPGWGKVDLTDNETFPIWPLRPGKERLESVGNVCFTLGEQITTKTEFPDGIDNDDYPINCGDVWFVLRYQVWYHFSVFQSHANGQPHRVMIHCKEGEGVLLDILSERKPDDRSPHFRKGRGKGRHCAARLYGLPACGPFQVEVRYGKAGHRLGGTTSYQAAVPKASERVGS
ncbi:hypothetical protein M427DRAFT_323843 [Gonapodya prolifera JEL478]|uniref:Uncharacterized protein n=1 Tax=Gonapodya prolifera (strain JEL478) TaxID=1344416 RepID=A0A139AFY9_GONPJ|nr:hypothetical protein M427DRAFT_323843 [Gonapodya prolifera JEL478]|eukprot:KXS15345.1 hypothetical protein M427DRAFT_323843 [Gonapodya prolifera JEL478]